MTSALASRILVGKAAVLESNGHKVIQGDRLIWLGSFDRMDPYVFAVAHQINPRDLFVGLGFFAKQSIIHFSPIPSQSRLWSCGKTHYDHLIAEGPRISKTHLSAKSEAQLKFRSLSSRTIASTRHRCNYRQKTSRRLLVEMMAGSPQWSMRLIRTSMTNHWTKTTQRREWLPPGSHLC